TRQFAFHLTGRRGAGSWLLPALNPSVNPCRPVPAPRSAMALKPALQTMSEWVKEAAEVATGAVKITLESGPLKDTLKDFCEIGGVAGALFKLGSRLIPDPTPEQRIALALHQTFLTTLDKELHARPNLTRKETWREYLRTQGAEVATAKLSAEFTWLAVFGGRGHLPSRSWPLVADLADVGRAWVAHVAAKDVGMSSDIEKDLDVIRG